jgi:hypothetical protein
MKMEPRRPLASRFLLFAARTNRAGFGYVVFRLTGGIIPAMANYYLALKEPHVTDIIQRTRLVTLFSLKGPKIFMSHECGTP